MVEHAKVVWVIRTSLLRNQRHWTHPLWWNIQRLFEWSGHLSWKIRGTGLTSYGKPGKGCLSDQNIPPEKSEALDSPAMVDHAKVVWVIRTSLLRNQRHWTHQLSCKGCFSDQDISPEKSEALDSLTMLDHAKVVWVIRTFLQRNQRHWTHPLWWNMQRLFEWLEHPFWKIRGAGLTNYGETCKGCLSDQNIPPEKSEALDSHPMLKVVWVIRTSLLRNQRHRTHPLWWNMQRLFEWLGHLSWEIRATGLTFYVGTYKGCLSDQDIPSEKSEPLDPPTMMKHAKVVWVIRTSPWEIRGTRLTSYGGTCKGCLSDQDIPSEKSQALDSQPMLEHLFHWNWLEMQFIFI